MTESQKIALRISQVRQRLNEISGLESDDLSTEIRSEAQALETEYMQLETRSRAAIIGEGQPVITPVSGDAEYRERVELRSKASLTNYLLAAAKGQIPSGAEAELNAAAGVTGGIPLELWDVGRREQRVDVVTDAPGTVGVNLDAIRPAVFANAVLPKLGVEMPRVESGTYASATIDASLTAGAQAQGGEAMSSAATFAVTTATPSE